MRTSAVFVVALLATIVAARLVNEQPSGRKVLAVVDNLKVRSTHSIFFRQLEERGYKVDFVAANDDSGAKKFREYGIWNYNNLILFAPAADEFAGITVSDVLEFIDDGQSVIVAGDSRLGDATRELASECSIEFDQSGTFVIDHFNFDGSDDGNHNLIVADHFVNSQSVFGKSPIDPVLFRGIGQDIEEDSPVLYSLLSASSTSYSASTTESVKEPHVAGKKTSLVTALQARNNARVIFSGSLELFSDRFLLSGVARHDGKKVAKSGNEQFVKQVISWAFLERGLIRYRNVQHHKVGESIAPATYTIKDQVEFSVVLEEWNGEKWTPFLADDVQFEFIMLDPHVRRAMTHDASGLYKIQFQLPDRYGVFTFKVEYTRLGYGFFTAIERSPVRPFRHNEYERFIDAAFPYYASSFSLMIGLFIFSAFFLYHKDKKQ